MKKTLIFLLIVLLILPLVSPLSLDIKKVSRDEVMIYGLNEPASFDLEITNKGGNTNIEFYNLLGFDMEPKGKLSLSADETKEIQLKVAPIDGFIPRGFYTFEYFIKGDEDIKETLTFKMIDLEEAFEIGSGEIDPESNSLKIYLQNTVNFNFEEVTAKFSSAFFDLEESVGIGPNEKRSFEVQLNKEDFDKLIAGFYTLNAEITASDQIAEVEGTIKFVEKDIVTTTKRDYGLVITTKVIEKENQGNVVTNTETIIKKNIISRLFTSFSPQPDNVDRQGLNIEYTWSKKISPGETLEIMVKTNWLFPFLIILFVIAIVILTKQYLKTNLVLRKKVSFVRAKGGEFALKVTTFIYAKKYIERVNIIDRLPPLVKLYEKFGLETPSKVNEKNRRIEWDFEKLEAGETRVLSYVIYSKVGVLGRFALPAATAIYEKEGKIHETYSNKAFFVAEQPGQKFEE